MSNHSKIKPLAVLCLLLVMVFGSGQIVNAQTANLVGHWKLDDGSGTTALDSSGSGSNGTLVNGPGWSVGKINGALSFDGVNDNVVINNIAPYDFDRTESFTISSWVNLTGTTGPRPIVGNQMGDGTYRGWMAYILNGSGLVRFELLNFGRGNGIQVTSTSPVNDGSWRHVVITYDGSSNANGVKLYIDGIPNTLTVSANTLSATTVSTDSLNIGHREKDSLYFKGLIDDTRIYSRALSVSEISDLYNLANSPTPTPTPAPSPTPSPTPTSSPFPSPSPTPTPTPSTSPTLPVPNGLVSYWGMDETSGTQVSDSKAVNNGTANCAAITQGKINNGRSFNGSSHYINIPNNTSLNFPTSSFTISAWFKTSATGNGRRIISKWANFSNINYEIFISQNGSLAAGVYDGSYTPYIADDTQVYTDGTWHHAVMVVNNTNIQLYIDGVLKKTATHDNSFPTNNLSVNIGACAQSGACGGYFSGVMDEVGVWNRALTDQEVLSVYNYNGNPTPNPDPTPPSSVITSPQNNAAASGTIAVDVTATDNVAVNRVELLVDGVVKLKDATNPYQLILSTALFSQGPHTLVARAFDTSGNSSDSQLITVNVDNTASATKPNIVFILLDDNRFDQTMQFMPLTNSLLGSQSVKFNNAFVAVPLCCPSRASILSGQYSHNHGVLENSLPQGGVQAFNDSSTIATWLKQAGYKTGMFGKYLNNYYQVAPYIPPGWDDWRGGDAVAEENLDFNYSLNENGVIVNYGNQPQDYATDVLATKIVNFIENTPQGQPLFTYFAPHAFLPATQDVGTFSSYPNWRPISYDEADVSDKPIWVRNLSPIPPNPTVCNYSFCIGSDDFHRMTLETLQAVDRAVASIVDALSRTGRLNNTVIIVTSDNGLSWGEHRWLNAKWCVYEECVKVPLWIRVPGVAGRTDNKLSVNVDFAPTFAEWAGVVPPTNVDGYSMATLLKNPSAPWPTERLLEYLGVSGPFGVPERRFRAVHTSQYVYSEYDNGDREFYDLIADPLQLQNSFTNPIYLSTITTLQNALSALR